MLPPRRRPPRAILGRMTHLTRQQSREIDRLAVERYGIPMLVLMENAARSAADVACDILDNNCVGQVLILCGGGNNGGDGLALARHMHNRGADVQILLCADPAKYRDEAMVNYRIAQAMGLPTSAVDPERLARSRATLLVDAIFGTGLAERPREPFDAIAEAVAKVHGVPVLSLDIPSGLDCDTGKPLSPHTIRATCTVTFVAEKAGFVSEDARPYLGQVTVGDIGVPRKLVREIMASGTSATAG